jgi:acetoacetyl-CoA reductase
MGHAIARELSCSGAKLVIHHHPDMQEGADNLVHEIRAEGREAIALPGDVTCYEDCERVIEGALQAFGRIDILVNNAGINRDRMLHRMSQEEWHSVIDVDLNGAFHMTRAAVPYLRDQQFGRIINIASMIGQTGNIGQANYAAAKAGLIAFTKSAALELARFNVTVNAICPGFVNTPMVQALTDEVREVILADIPMGRFGEPEEIASLVRFIVTEGNWITGQQFNPNGGQFM